MMDTSEGRRRRVWQRIAAYGAMLLLSLLALAGIAAARGTVIMYRSVDGTEYQKQTGVDGSSLSIANVAEVGVLSVPASAR
jgi:hypothetical protein